MSAFVVDTNVPVVANGRNPQANPDCVVSCIKKLTEIRERGLMVLDDEMRILQEYMSNLSMSGQPGAGDMFMKWVWTIQADESRCEQVHLTTRDDDPTNFAEFPIDPDLENFDPSDRKFVAVALASENNPVIVNAVDSDWAEKHAALERHGLVIEFICPQHVCP